MSLYLTLLCASPPLAAYIFWKYFNPNLSHYENLIEEKELLDALGVLDFNGIKAPQMLQAYKKLKDKKCPGSWKTISHKSFFKGRTLQTQRQLVHLIKEDLDFQKQKASKRHRTLRFYERISSFYADRELHSKLLIPSPDGEGFLRVVKTFSMAPGLCASLYQKISPSPDCILVLRGTGLHPQQSQYLHALYEDCLPTIGQSCRHLSFKALQQHLPQHLPCTLIGMSLGGAQAMILYARFPEKFSRLVTVNAPYVHEKDNEELKKNCQKMGIKPHITILQTYEDHVQDLGRVHIGEDFEKTQGHVEIFLLKKDPLRGESQGKYAPDLFEKRYAQLFKDHQVFSFTKTLGYTLNLLRQLRDKHQENLTRGPYLYDHRSNENRCLATLLNNHKDFKKRFDKLRRKILKPLAWALRPWLTRSWTLSGDREKEGCL